MELCGRRLASLTPHERATTVGFVTTDKVRIANLACEDVVALGRAPYTNWIGRMQEADRAVVERSLRLVGMSAFARKTMDRMSDGECQRVMIARVRAQDTPVILLDEPTAFLDLPNRYSLATLLGRLARDEGKCILFSTHDLDVALSLCDSVALIDTPSLHHLPAGEMVGSGLIERLFSGENARFAVYLSDEPVLVAVWTRPRLKAHRTRPDPWQHPLESMGEISSALLSVLLVHRADSERVD